MTFPLAVIEEVTKTIEAHSNGEFLLGYRLSPEELEKNGIRLEDSLFFAETIKGRVDYLSLSMASYKRTSINDPADTRLILGEFAKVIANEIPIIGTGSVEKSSEAEEVLNSGGALVGIGRELLREPQWVQKIQANEEESIRTMVSQTDLDELAIPRVMQVYLTESFYKVMHFTSDTKQAESYHNQVAPMEGFEKKL